MVPSLSTPGEKVALTTWLIELVMTRRNKGRPLPPKFWNELKYRGQFRREIMALNKGIKEYGQTAVIRATYNNFLDTFTDYQQFTYLLQMEMERLKRLANPKDLTEVVMQEPTILPKDLRPEYFVSLPARQQGKKSLFDRLKELEGE